MRTLTLFCALCAFLCAAPASAKVAVISLEELVAESEEIVVATVTALSPESPVDNETYVTVWSDVGLPSGTPTINGPDPQFSFIVSVELERVEALIEGRRSASLRPTQ